MLWLVIITLYVGLNLGIFVQTGGGNNFHCHIMNREIRIITPTFNMYDNSIEIKIS